MLWQPDRSTHASNLGHTIVYCDNSGIYAKLIAFSLNAFQHIICEILDSRGKYLKVFAAP